MKYISTIGSDLLQIFHSGAVPLQTDMSTAASALKVALDHLTETDVEAIDDDLCSVSSENSGHDFFENYHCYTGLLMSLVPSMEQVYRQVDGGEPIEDPPPRFSGRNRLHNT